MVGILGFVSKTLADIGVPYEYGEWTQEVSYPYFVGTYREISYRYEDGCTAGTFTLDGWARGSKLSLVEAAESIKEAFADLRTVDGSSCYYICYSSTDFIPSGEADLFRVSITLNTYEWKGE